MSSLSYEASKKKVFAGFWLLFFVTLIEVFFSLMGKGHLPFLKSIPSWLLWATAIIIVVLSLYKAYFIVYEFMHMKYEAKGMAMTVLLPTLLLVWAIIAFFHEGNAWKERRADVKEMDRIEISATAEQSASDGVKIME